MITPIDIKKSIVSALKEKYKRLPIYGADVKEGLKMPSFFVQLLPSTVETENINSFRSDYLLVITYFQKTKDEADMLKCAFTIQQMFAKRFRVKDRSLEVKDFNYDFTGEHDDILQINITLSYLDAWEKEEKEPQMKELLMNSELEE